MGNKSKKELGSGRGVVSHKHKVQVNGLNIVDSLLI